MQHVVKDGQSIFDIAIKTIGSIENLYAFISSNPQITSIDYDFNANPNQVLSFIQTAPVVPDILAIQNVITNNTGTIKGRYGQSLFDIVLMTTGSIDTMYSDLLITNNISEVNNQDISKVSFSFDKTKIKDVLVYNYFQKKSTIINTGTLSASYKVLETENNKYITTENGYLILL